MEKYLKIGKIINTHGIKGEVKVEPWTDDAEFLKKFKYFFIDEKPFKLLSARVHKNFSIVALEGVEDLGEAKKLKNKVIMGDREGIELEEGQFFIQDIIGASVMDEDGKELGKLSEVLFLPANNVYVVNGDREILIPAVPEFIINTDIEAGVVTVRLIDGM